MAYTSDYNNVVGTYQVDLVKLDLMASRLLVLTPSRHRRWIAVGLDSGDVTIHCNGPIDVGRAGHQAGKKNRSIEDACQTIEIPGTIQLMVEEIECLHVTGGDQRDCEPLQR